MQLSTKLTLTILLAGLGLLLSASPAQAVPIPPGDDSSCIVQAEKTFDVEGGGAYYRLSTTCPVGYREEFNINIIAGGTIVDDKEGVPGAGGSVSVNMGPFDPGTYEARLSCSGPGMIEYCGPATFTIADPDPGPGPGPSPDPDDACNGGTGIKTGLGCIPTDPTGLVEKILQIAIGVASGIAMLLLIAGAFKILTSSGDPKAVMSAKDTITSAIAGLLLILLSVAILNIIGLNILGIPIWKTP